MEGDFKGTAVFGLPLRFARACRPGWNTALAFGCVVLLASSVGGRPSQPGAAPSTLAWPPPPERTRIVYRHSFSRASDLGWKRVWWRKLADWLMNETDPSVLTQPYAIVFDSQWRMIIADVGAHEVKIFDPAKKNVKRIRGYKKKLFGMPLGLAVDEEDNFYVADSAAGRVLKYSPEGKLLDFIGGEEGNFKRPSGLAFDRKNSLLYVVDTVRPRVFVYRPDGQLVRQFGRRGAGPGEFNYPTFIGVDPQGMVYVNDTLNFRVQVMTPEGRFVRQFGSLGDGTGQMSRSKGVAIDSEGHIYVADALFPTVQIFDPRGRFLLNFGSNGSGPAQFYMPAGVTIDKLDYVYVADPYHGRIEVFHYLAERPSTVAATPAGGGQ